MIKQQARLTTRDFELIYEISTAIHAILDLDEMLQSILAKIKSAFQIEGASLALHNPEQREFYFIRTVEDSKNRETERIKKMRFPDHVGVAAWVLQNNRSVIVPDVANDTRFFKDIDFKDDFVTRSMICAPLSTRKGFLGVLYALNKLKGEFTEKEAWFLESLAGTIAIAIENAKLYGELKQHASSLERENLRLKSDAQNRFNLQGIIGSSPAMLGVFGLLEKVVNTPTTVLIQGETGTGKELIAKAVHYNGPLKDKPFIAENCGALAETLLESELFGHVKGSFTGAISDKKGIFELASGGAVFLDEIGEIPPPSQVKLLRVLQEGQVRPVGGIHNINVDVRLISSTNRNLQEEVKKGNFREDLFYRINVFQITLPPLRERKEDIPLLADHFLKKIARKFKRPSPKLTSPALIGLTRYEWPGNVRELENEIERAMTLAGTDEEIREEHLSEKIRGILTNRVLTPGAEDTIQAVVERLEKQMITEALQKSNGNRTHAARKLGLTRQGLLNKIARYKIKL
jgi:Nif-specific regulatory protein